MKKQTVNRILVALLSIGLTAPAAVTWAQNTAPNSEVPAVPPVPVVPPNPAASTVNSAQPAPAAQLTPQAPKRDVRFLYKINTRDAAEISVGDPVHWAGNTVGVVKSVHQADEQTVYVGVQIDEEGFNTTRGVLNDKDLKQHPNLRVDGIALRTRIERLDPEDASDAYLARLERRGEADAAPPANTEPLESLDELNEEVVEEREEELAEARREEIVDETAATTREVADDVGDWTEETFEEAADWTAEAARKAEPALAAFGEWAEGAGHDVKKYAQAGWEETKDAYAIAVDKLSVKLAELDEWADRRSQEANLEEEARDLQDRVDRLQANLRSMSDRTAAELHQRAEMLISESRSLAIRLQAVGEHEKAEDLEEAASELRVEVARAMNNASGRETALEQPRERTERAW